MQRGSHHTAWMTSTAKDPARGRGEPWRRPCAEPRETEASSGDVGGREPPGVQVILPIRLNGVERAIPLRLARAGVAAALCRGARLASNEGGVEAVVRDVPMLVARVSLPNAAPWARVQRRVAALAGDLLQVGMDAASQAWVPIGCIPGLYLCGTSAGGIEAHVHSERVGAPGGEVLRTVAESLARPLTRLAECAGAAPHVTLCELQHQRLEARCRIAAGALFEGGFSARSRSLEPADLRRDLELDRHDPPLAVAHNARVIEAMLWASAALGVDPGLWEGEARRYAGRWGSCEPLARWRCVRGELIGELRLPVVLGRAGANGAAPPCVSGAPPELRDVKDAMLQLAGVALAASLAFSCSRWQARATRALGGSASPPPLPAAGLDAGLSPSKRSSESGVHVVARGRGPALAG